MKHAYHACAAWIAGAALLAAAAGTHAQGNANDYPSRPITFYVGYAAGGSADIMGRLLMPALAARLGQPIVLDNRAGAGGIVGVEAVARGRPDGYTMGFGTAGTLASNINLMATLPYHPLRDLSPVSMVVSLPLVLVVSAAGEIRNVSDLLFQARTNRSVSFGSAGIGSSTHLAGELLNQKAGVKMVHVPYKGTAPAAADVIAGHLEAAFIDLPTAVPHMRSGRLRVLAVTSDKRTSLAPEIPTIAEAGVSGYNFISWFGVVMPAATNASIVNKVNHELVAVLQDPEMQQRVRAAGGDPMPTSPEKMTEIIRTEIEKTGQIIRSAGIKLD
jgi:tripartite-type tricarboxylate transporter receptor subunit TctC